MSIFGSVFIKKSNQTDFFIFSEIQTETEPNFLKTDHFRFGFYDGKIGKNRNFGFGPSDGLFDGLSNEFSDGLKN